MLDVEILSQTKKVRMHRTIKIILPKKTKIKNKKKKQKEQQKKPNKQKTIDK